MATVEQRYRVTDRLEAGGMAEVFRGEALSIQGFKRQVAIKRVLPHLAQNRAFMAMFLDEARLGARLSHTNIVSVLDIGAADNTYFLVMEFIDGCDLKALMEMQKLKGKALEVKHAIYIAMECCRGLAYAHELVDDDGKLLGIVHRDVSPPNILLSVRGEVKITDFGLAKATTQLETTDPGVVKGKFSYLSPEAAMAQPVDERTDVFAMGIVLWEMISGRKLFLGETDYQTVKLVQEASVPALDIDAELGAILQKSLQKDVNLRYQNANEFGEALAGYLFSHKMKVTAMDIANLVKEAQAHRKSKSRQKEPSIIDRLIQEEMLRFTSIDDVEEQDLAGAMPLDLLGGQQKEKAVSWFDLDEDVTQAVDAIAERSKSMSPEWEKGWVDVASHGPGAFSASLPFSGRPVPELKLGDDIAQILESTSVGRMSDILRMESEGKQSLRPSALEVNQKIPEGTAQSKPKTQETKKNQMNKGLGTFSLLLIAILLLAGALTAAYFGGVIPPEMIPAELKAFLPPNQ